MINLALFIISLLVVATVFIRVQIHQHASPERLNNWRRLIAWWLIFAVCLLAFSLGLVGITVLSFGLMGWIGIELFNMFGLSVTLPFVLRTGALITALLAGIFLWPGMSPLLFFISLALALVAYFTPVNSSAFRSSFYSFCVLSLASLILFVVLASWVRLDAGHLLLILFFITAANDIAQYISGKLFGKTKIARTLSPNKTLEGVLGGMLVSALLATYLLPTILFIAYTHAALIGAVLGLSGFLGDLNVSRVKRALNLKDTGTAIIGHGGLLDRIDSLLLIVPVFGAILVVGNHL